MLPHTRAALADAARARLETLADRRWVQYAAGDGVAEISTGAAPRPVSGRIRRCVPTRPHTAVRTDQTAAAPLLAAARPGPTLVPADVIPPHFAGRLLSPRPRPCAAPSPRAPGPTRTH
ncbi:hypothetical protein [Streptomyces sp. NPDC058249]|uniref:hypothetical protein n=1 Tax=Streptomyces sp. NPDC058249 TaxID=3346403 RepID=UPI0036E0D17F